MGGVNLASFPVELHRKSQSLPNAFQKLCVKPISNNTVTGSLPTYCQASVSKRTDTISWTVKVRTPPLTSPKSILVDRSYLTCAGGVERTDLRNHCPVGQESVVELDVLDKYKGSKKGACSFILNLVNKVWEVRENKDTAYAISR